MKRTKSCCLAVMGIFASICALGVILSMIMPKETNRSQTNHNYLPNVQNIQNKYDYNYYEAYTFSYRYASVKASIAEDTYWMQFYAKYWDK